MSVLKNRLGGTAKIRPASPRQSSSRRCGIDFERHGMPGELESAKPNVRSKQPLPGLSMTDLDQIKSDICEMGRRVYQREFAAAHDGNITVKISENEFLCTPTLTCKGFMVPGDIATIDSAGRQVSGPKKRSSEALLHLQIYKARPDIQSVVHCHPPHATAFGIAREPVPQCVLPEVEMYLGEVPITPYRTPGTEAFAETILPFIKKTNAIILANHGTVTYGEHVEQAYWRTEILDSYCRMLLLARQLGGISYLSTENVGELLELKKQWGFEDPRNTPEYENADLRNHCVFRDSWPESGLEPRAFKPPPRSRNGGPPAGSKKSGLTNTPDPNIGIQPTTKLDFDRLANVVAEEVRRQIENPGQ